MGELTDANNLGAMPAPNNLSQALKRIFLPRQSSLSPSVDAFRLLVAQLSMISQALRKTAYQSVIDAAYRFLAKLGVGLLPLRLTVAEAFFDYGFSHSHVSQQVANRHLLPQPRTEHLSKYALPLTAQAVEANPRDPRLRDEPHARVYAAALLDFGF